MTQKIQQLTDSLVNEVKSSGKDGKEKSLKDAFKQVPKETKKGMTDAAFQKSMRLAAIELARGNMQTLIDSGNWADEVRQVFPDATFRIYPRKRHIIIEV